MDFGEKIRQCRKEKKLTQANLAELAKIDITYLSKIENGKAEPPSEETIELLAKALGEDYSQLIYLAQRMPKNHQKIAVQSPSFQMMFRKIESNPKELVEIEKKIDKILADDC